MITDHGERRCMQRAIRKKDREIIIEYGRVRKRWGHVVEYTLTWKDALVYLQGNWEQRLDKIIGKSVLVDIWNDTIITAYPKTGRLKAA
jgi:hypothetical protein